MNGYAALAKLFPACTCIQVQVWRSICLSVDKHYGAQILILAVGTNRELVNTPQETPEKCTEHSATIIVLEQMGLPLKTGIPRYQTTILETEELSLR